MVQWRLGLSDLPSGFLGSRTLIRKISVAFVRHNFEMPAPISEKDIRTYYTECHASFKEAYVSGVSPKLRCDLNLFLTLRAMPQTGLKVLDETFTSLFETIDAYRVVALSAVTQLDSNKGKRDQRVVICQEGVWVSLLLSVSNQARDELKCYGRRSLNVVHGCFYK